MTVKKENLHCIYSDRLLDSTVKSDCKTKD